VEAPRSTEEIAAIPQKISCPQVIIVNDLNKFT